MIPQYKYSFFLKGWIPNYLLNSCVDLNFKRYHDTTLLLIILMMVLLTHHSYSQPFAAGKSKFLGNVYSNNVPSADWDTYWNQVTPENAGKWQWFESTRGVYSYGGVDNVSSYAKQRGIPWKFHTLVWGQAYPDWIVSANLDTIAKAIEERTKFVGQRYPDMESVDVVNEPLSSFVASASWPYANKVKDALGGSGTTGWDFVIKPFEWARKYCDQKVKLILNEYNLLNNDGRTTTFLQIVDSLKKRKLIDAIGIQAHRFEIEVAAVSSMKNNLDRLAATGLPIYISEFDLGNISNAGTPNDSVQLALYKQRFPFIWNHPAVRGITIWGYIEGAVWQTSTFLRRGSGVERPALQWLRSYIVPPPVPSLISPSASKMGVPRNTRFVWNSTETATQYGIQIAYDSLFSSVVLDLTVTDTLMNCFPLDSNKKFYWHVNAANSRDTSDYSVISSFTTGNQITAVKECEGISTEFRLAQNYPNPFNPTTIIRFEIPHNSYASIKIFNSLGQLVVTLIDNVIASGEHSVEWNALNVPSGIYFYRLQTEKYSETKKLLLLK
jgi:GH35 family endo-1,4-beta-xylanase